MTETVYNPLLERARMPGESFTLPSLGVFYNKGEVTENVKNGEIYLSPMVTLDEITLNSPDKLYSGDAIDEVLKRCCPDLLHPKKLLAQDVDFILTALWKISYGNMIDIDYTHDCKDAKKQTYSIDTGGYLSNTIRINPTTINETYKVTLSNGQNLKLKPPSFETALHMYQAALDKSLTDLEELESNVLNSISEMIIQVDEISDQTMIYDWLKILKANHIRDIRKAISSIEVFGANFTTTAKCKDCGEEIDITSEINPVSFFLIN